jgi:ribosome biogenesis GTPase
MPQDNLTRRHLRSARKGMVEHADRLERKERQRKRAAERAAGPSSGPRRRDWSDDSQIAPERVTETRSISTPQRPGTRALVLEAFGRNCRVSVDGRKLDVVVARGLRPVAGDRVVLDVHDRLVELLPRTSALTRGGGDASRRNGGEDQVIAANVDLAVLICTPQSPPLRPALIDRYLISAARDRVTPIVCLNKIDLGVEDDLSGEIAGFGRLGITVVRTSALTGEGIVELRELLTGKTSVFTGHSGVGKSSLLNALVPGLALRVGSVTAATSGQGKGRHTTTSARLITLDVESHVVDAPGIRMWAIHGVGPSTLIRFFPDLLALSEECVYRDCAHEDERGCAVIRAAAADPILQRRLHSYTRIRAELTS